MRTLRSSRNQNTAIWVNIAEAVATEWYINSLTQTFISTSCSQPHVLLLTSMLTPNPRSRASLASLLLNCSPLLPPHEYSPGSCLCFAPSVLLFQLLPIFPRCAGNVHPLDTVAYWFLILILYYHFWDLREREYLELDGQQRKNKPAEWEQQDV